MANQILPPNRRPNSADFADLFCRFGGGGFCDFAASFCRLVGASGILGHLIWRRHSKMCSFTLGHWIILFLSILVVPIGTILGRTMNCSLYGPKQGPSCFFPPSDASVWVNTQLWLAEMYGFPATFHWVQVKVGGRKGQGLVPLEYVQPPRVKVQALLKHLFTTMTAQMHHCAVHQSSQCPSNCTAQPQRATKCVLCSRTTCVQGTRFICIWAPSCTRDPHFEILGASW